MRFPQLPLDRADEAVSFTTIDVDLPPVLEASSGARVALYLAAVAKTYGRSLASLDYVFCSDTALHKMNLDHLGHDTLTDIITFDLSDDEEEAESHEADILRESDQPSSSSTGSSSIEGECYISLDRVRDNATSFGESLDRELLRVMTHGLLHLCGQDDKTDEQQRAMRSAETRALARWRDL